MYQDVNRIVLTGRVYEEPEMRFTEDGKPYATFLLQCMRRRKHRKEQPDLFFARASGKRLAALCRCLVPDTCVLVEGRLQTRADDTQNGIIWFGCQVRVRRLIILSPPPEMLGSGVLLPRSPRPAPSTTTAEIESCLLR